MIFKVNGQGHIFEIAIEGSFDRILPKLRTLTAHVTRKRPIDFQGQGHRFEIVKILEYSLSEYICLICSCFIVINESTCQMEIANAS